MTRYGCFAHIDDECPAILRGEIKYLSDSFK